MVGVEVWRSLLFRGGVHYVFGSENGGRGCYILGASRCLLWGGRVSLFLVVKSLRFFCGEGRRYYFRSFFLGWGAVESHYFRDFILLFAKCDGSWFVSKLTVVSYCSY